MPPDRRVVSVIIPARNEEATIEGAVAPLLADPVEDEVEVIVADGRSTDGTREVVEALAARDPRVRLVDNPARVTPEGLNAAIRVSRGDVIVRMDGHAVPEPGYLAACLRALASSGAWNVGGRMEKVGMTAAGRAASAATTSPFGIGGGRRFHLVREAVDVDSVWLGCWPRWVFERVGLFDPEMVQDQDEELNQRILDAGGRIRFDPSIGATYVSRASWRGLLRQYFRYGLFKVRAIQKRPSLLRMRHLAPAGLVAVVLGGLVAGLVVPGAPLVSLGVVVAWLAAATWFGRAVAGDFGASVPEVIAAYACLHVGYGMGTWVGLLRFGHRWLIRRQGAVPVLEGPDRMTEQDDIRATYESYAASGRRRLWDRSNRGYGRLSRERDAAVVDLLWSSVPTAGGRVLDVGCGDGSLAARAREAGLEATWTGIDLLPERIDAARSAVPDAEFVVGSADALPFDDRSFDVAVALTLFSSLPSRAFEVAVAGEIGRVLRPGGWLVWYDLRYDNPTNRAVHGMSRARLGELFADWLIEVRTISLAPPIARRLGPLTPVAYPILHALPPLRSHLVGRIRCPS